MKEKLNLDRTARGELSRIRLHDTTRPKPVDRFNVPPQVPGPPSDINKVPEAIGSLKAQGRL
jgi:hypothetical protein